MKVVDLFCSYVCLSVRLGVYVYLYVCLYSDLDVQQIYCRWLTCSHVATPVLPTMSLLVNLTYFHPPTHTQTQKHFIITMDNFYHKSLQKCLVELNLKISLICACSEDNVLPPTFPLHIISWTRLNKFKG